MEINYKPEPYADYFRTEHLKTDLKTRAVRGASVTVAGQVTSFAVQMGGTIMLARLLTPDDFGLVTMVLSISLLLQNFGGNGFIEAVVQRKEIDHKQISTLFWINAGISLLLMAAFIASAPLIAALYKEPRLKPIVAAMAASIFFGGLSNQHVSLLIRNMQFLHRTVNEVSAAVISVGVALLLAWRGFGYWALVVKWLLAPLLIAIGSWIMCGWRPGIPSRGAGVGPMLRFAFHTYGNFVMTYFRRNADKMLIGRFYGSHSLGFYDRAYHLSNMLPVQILTPLNGVSLAAFSRLTDDHEKYRHNYLKVLSLLAFVGMPLSAALTVTAQDVILLLFGEKWSHAGLIFRAFGPSIGVAIIYLTHGWLHLSLGTPDRWFRWSIAEFAVTVLCFSTGLFFGAWGVAAAFSASFYILIGPALWYAGKPVGLTFSSVVSRLWRYYVSALLAGTATWILLRETGFAADVFRTLPVLARILVSGLLCICLYLVLITGFYKSTRPITEFISMAREMILKRHAVKKT